MAYTEFRKSYGDFEVVIPPVKFRLPAECTAHVVKGLRSYEIGFVCNHLGGYVGGTSAAFYINNMISRWQSPSSALGSAIERSFGDEENEFVPYFSSRLPAGVVLRKAWCEHLAREIEREYGLEPNPYVLEEH